MSIEYRVGDVFDRLSEIPDGSIDLIVSSPPFLALRSYLPADHPDKGKEIGQEPTPAAFIDTHLALAAEYARVLAPHGTLCYEIGDTFAGSGGAGGDYNTDGLREGQEKFKGSAVKRRTDGGQYGNHPGGGDKYNLDTRPNKGGGSGWPLAKSMCVIPHLFTASLAYGRNLLTGEESPAGSWRIRNVICWARPNPPVGALGDKFRPATSYITVACKGSRRYFDLDAVRTPYMESTLKQHKNDNGGGTRNGKKHKHEHGSTFATAKLTNAGAPPLDWHADEHPEDGDWLWKLPTQPYKGSHFATFPMSLPKRLIEAMCPQRVCRVCGKPSERITERTPEYAAIRSAVGDFNQRSRDGAQGFSGSRNEQLGDITSAQNVTIGWTDCGHDDWRTGNVLDPFGGSGTTGEAAQAVGRHAILIDLDSRNAELARQRVGMFLEVTT